jgi:hypothetical protein
LKETEGEKRRSLSFTPSPSLPSLFNFHSLIEEEAMSQALQFIQEGFGDSSFIALKEWAGPNGEMGVYQSQDYGFIYLLVLIDASNRTYYQQQYTRELKHVALYDAVVIATFAGAQEIAELRGERE